MTRTTQQLFDLTGKTVLVTGGSRGLGLQMAHALGEAGAKIMLSSRKAEDLEQAAAQLQAAGIDARWIAADCSCAAACSRSSALRELSMIFAPASPRACAICKPRPRDPPVTRTVLPVRSNSCWVVRVMFFPFGLNGLEWIQVWLLVGFILRSRFATFMVFP